MIQAYDPKGAVYEFTPAFHVSLNSVNPLLILTGVHSRSLRTAFI